MSVAKEDSIIDRVVDFQIFGGGADHQKATELHMALRSGGFESRHLTNSTMEWLVLGGGCYQAMLHVMERARLFVFFYSEADARSHDLYKDDVLLDDDIKSTLGQAFRYALPVVVVTQGKWHLPQSVIPVINYPSGGVPALIATLFSVAGVALFERRLREEKRAELVRLFRSGLMRILGGRISILIFGPGRPSERWEDITSDSGLLWKVREELRIVCEECGWLSVYGEDLCSMPAGKIELDMNVSLQERVLATNADVVIMLSGSVGVAAEIGVFSQYPDLCQKAQIWISSQHTDGFVAKGPVAELENEGASVETFTVEDLREGRLGSMVLRKLGKHIEKVISERRRRHSG